MDGVLLTVPHYVKAKTPDLLIKALLRENARFGICFKYFDIQSQGGYWYAWYLRDATTSVKQQLEADLG